MEADMNGQVVYSGRYGIKVKNYFTAEAKKILAIPKPGKERLWTSLRLK
jgi:hypothetical protein